MKVHTSLPANPPPRSLNKNALPPAGRLPVRSLNLWECMRDQERPLKAPLREEYMKNYGSAPADVVTASHGKSRGRFPNHDLTFYPEPTSRYKQHVDSHLERVKGYLYTNEPLAKSRQRDFLQPHKLRMAGTTMQRSPDIKYTIQPPALGRLDAVEQGQEGHSMYVLSHHDYDVGEQPNRKYNWYGRDPAETKFGMDTKTRTDGWPVKQVMTWDHDAPGVQRALCVSSRFDTFQERFKPAIGKTLDPNKDTRDHLDPAQRFGAKWDPQGHGMFQILFNRTARDLPYGQEKLSGLVANVMEHIKRANYHNFDSTEEAWANFDREGRGHLRPEDVRLACWRFNIPLDDKLLHALMRTCWVDEADEGAYCKETATLDYGKFVRMLTWPQIYGDQPNFQTFGAMANDTVARMGDYNHLVARNRNIMRRPHRTEHLTTYAEVGVGVDTGEAIKGWTSHGIPTMRTDIRAPRVPKLNNYTNYGDGEIMYGLLRPTMFDRYGVYKRDLLEPRSEAEMRKLMVASGPQLDDVTFTKVWKLAAAVSSFRADEKNRASVKAFLMVLKKISRKTDHEKSSEFRVTRTFDEPRVKLNI